MTRLPPVLSPADLPEVELNAALLDGEVFRVGDAYSPVDEIVGVRHRAAAVSIGLPPRLIAEQLSAAWVWGAITLAPTRHQYCVQVGARVRPPGVAWMTVREVVLTDTDLAVVGPLRLTTPVRTAVDLARFSPQFDTSEVQIVRSLMRIGQFGPSNVRDHIDARRNLPNKLQALERLRRCG